MNSVDLYWIDPKLPADHFPDLTHALEEPNGLLAFGGDLSPERLIAAYERGIFPWYSKHEPILWWSPNPRSIIIPNEFKPSRSLRKKIRRNEFQITLDHSFPEVIKSCAAPRQYSDETWITEEMMEAYIQLHQFGIAHSVEAWKDNNLVGGLYGVSLGKAFFGESMFSTATDASKVCLALLIEQLKQWNFELIDCQVSSEHMESLGAREIPRSEFMNFLSSHCSGKTKQGKWSFDPEFTTTQFTTNSASYQ